MGEEKLRLLKETQTHEKQERLKELVLSAVERDYKQYFKERAESLLSFILGEKWEKLSDEQRERLAEEAANRIVNMLADQFVSHILMTYDEEGIASIVEDLESMDREEKRHLVGVLLRLLSGGEVLWDENMAQIINEIARSVDVQKSFRRKLKRRLDLFKQDETTSEETIEVGGASVNLDALANEVAMAAEKLQNLANNRDELLRIFTGDPQLAGGLYEAITLINDALGI